jgi:hypothetical protein
VRARVPARFVLSSTDLRAEATRPVPFGHTKHTNETKGESSAIPGGSQFTHSALELFERALLRAEARRPTSDDCLFVAGTSYNLTKNHFDNYSSNI